jgi:hypothetical protein
MLDLQPSRMLTLNDVNWRPFSRMGDETNGVVLVYNMTVLHEVCNVPNKQRVFGFCQGGYGLQQRFSLRFNNRMEQDRIKYSTVLGAQLSAEIELSGTLTVTAMKRGASCAQRTNTDSELRTYGRSGRSLSGSIGLLRMGFGRLRLSSRLAMSRERRSRSSFACCRSSSIGGPAGAASLRT